MNRKFYEEAEVIQLLKVIVEKLEKPVKQEADKSLSVKQVSERLGFSVRQIRRWMEDGAITFVKIGTSRFFSERYINELLSPH